MVSVAPTRAGPAAGSLTPATRCAGTNPQNLVEKILRAKIYNHAYWKEHCFGLTAESLVDKAMEIEAVGGTFGGILEPTTFICLMLKMLQVGLAAHPLPPPFPLTLRTPRTTPHHTLLPSSALLPPPLPLAPPLRTHAACTHRLHALTLIPILILTLTPIPNLTPIPIPIPTPTPTLTLALTLTLTLNPNQIQPEKEIVVEFIKNEDYKYVLLFLTLALALTWP
jgi:hypothetical protein